MLLRLNLRQCIPPPATPHAYSPSGYSHGRADEDKDGLVLS